MGIKWSRGERGSRGSDGSGLAEEAEAFLCGTYANYCRSRGINVPRWAWLNRFAHGDLKSVRESHRLLTHRAWISDVEWHEEPWVHAQRIIGKDILAFVGDDAVLLRLLQRAVLVPLELKLMRSQLDSGLTNYELVDFVRTALRKCLS